MFEEVLRDLQEYSWNEKDFLLTTFSKNGTHLMWEIMMMLLRGSADYITDGKVACMIDLFPLKKTEAVFPSPRVLNTHYRLDVLPKAFRGRKTVVVMRNPKDTAVSYYYHKKNVQVNLPVLKEFVAKLTLSEMLEMFLEDKDMPYGRYFDYIEYMWSLRDEPNILLVFFEDLINDPVSSIHRVNEFMGTERSAELFSLLANNSQKQLENIHQKIYRKGKIGDWKNHLTVAENEKFDEFLAKWPLSREIPFTYC
ncbi:hypothetical protein EB796_018807 [Bugula neritina]|uniref:Sulfotransferase domain-containing protein n=1 Tax=Bugula neritina TaxID=10212 RepID=A0A7J7JB69_BUGNE|nr:hypothetical protein EB796_018807 [Bugula neritina]